MEPVEEDLTCVAAGCGTESVALAPCVVIPDETDAVAIATAPMVQACGEHVDVLWERHVEFGVPLLMRYVAGADSSERTRIALQEFAAVLSIHDNPRSKATAGLISAAVTDGMVLQLV